MINPNITPSYIRCLISTTLIVYLLFIENKLHIKTRSKIKRFLGYRYLYISDINILSDELLNVYKKTWCPGNGKFEVLALLPQSSERRLLTESLEGVNLTQHVPQPMMVLIWCQGVGHG